MDGAADRVATPYRHASRTPDQRLRRDGCPVVGVSDDGGTGSPAMEIVAA